MDILFYIISFRYTMVKRSAAAKAARRRQK